MYILLSKVLFKVDRVNITVLDRYNIKKNFVNFVLFDILTVEI